MPPRRDSQLDQHGQADFARYQAIHLTSKESEIKCELDILFLVGRLERTQMASLAL